MTSWLNSVFICSEPQTCWCTFGSASPLTWHYFENQGAIHWPKTEPFIRGHPVCSMLAVCGSRSWILTISGFRAVLAALSCSLLDLGDFRLQLLEPNPSTEPVSCHPPLQHSKWHALKLLKTQKMQHNILLFMNVGQTHTAQGNVPVE